MARGFGSEAVCTDAFTSWGWSETAWINYLNSMLNYEASLHSPKQLMVGLVGTSWIRNAPHAVAATAVPARDLDTATRSSGGAGMERTSRSFPAAWAYFHRKWTKIRPKLSESFSTRW